MPSARLPGRGWTRGAAVTAGYVIRPATSADADLLVEFTMREAKDAEGASLDPAWVRRGVIAALADPRLAQRNIAAAASSIS